MQRPATTRRRLLGWVLGLAGLFSNGAFAQALSLTVDDDSSLPRLLKGGEVVQIRYQFWGANWAWAGQDSRPSQVRGLERRFEGRNETLGTQMTGEVSAPSADSLQWRWTFEARRAVKPVIGGGIEFDFDLQALGAAMGEPALLPERRGWTWGRPGGERVELRFDPPLADVAFEGGRKNRIRAFFYKDAIAAGTIEHSAMMTVSGGARVQPPDSVRLGLAGAPQWPVLRMDSADVGIDLSFLNAADRPAGKLGAVRADGDRLVLPDGTPVRFWGTNLAAAALFSTPREQVAAQARRLARLGFNLVRIHHHDSPWTYPNLFGDPAGPGTRRIDPKSRDALDWWIKCLQDEGIRIWLDLHVQRHVKAADGIDFFDELPRAYDHGHRDIKGFSHINRSLQAAMDEFAAAYLSAVNPYTRRSLLDDPAVLAVQVTNENDITHHFGNSLLPDKNVPRHNALYMAAAERFAAQHRLPRDRVWRSWEAGPSKLFLNDLEASFHRERIARLRALGLKAPLSTTSQWGDSPLSSLPALTLGEIIDVHSYGRRGELDRNPALQGGLTHFISTSQLIGRPLTVSEWNMGSFPTPDRHTLPLYLAATGAHQGWDSLIQYAYSQMPLRNDGGTDGWSMFNDPAMVVPMAAAALMYRQGHLKEARSTVAFMPTPVQLFSTDLASANAPALRLAAERSRLVVGMPATPELAWLRPDTVPAGAQRLVDPLRGEAPPSATRIVTDTGEAVRDWGQGSYTIDTPRSQGAVGFIGGRRIELADITFELESPNASVSVHSLDGRPIAQSRELLVALSAVNLPAGDGKAGFRSQPLGGELSIRAPAGLRPSVAAEGRSALAPSAWSYAEGRYRLALGTATGARWILLRAP